MDYVTVSFNHADYGGGGGIYNDINENVLMTIDHSQIGFNTANHYGGGIYNLISNTITIKNSQVISNTAGPEHDGGGISNGGGVLTVTNTIFSGNVAGENGDAVDHDSGSTAIHNSCIFGNGDAALNNFRGDRLPPLYAENNWWGASDGPSGLGPGTGDSVGNGVVYTPFLVSKPTICGDTEIGLEATVRPNHSEATIGDTITYTYRITNTGIAMLTIAAHDNRLGNIGGLSGELAPQISAEAILTYTVQSNDPLGSLINTVTVTGTDSSNTFITTSATASVTIHEQEESPALMRLPWLQWKLEN
jgi:hypothetical protein